MFRTAVELPDLSVCKGTKIPAHLYRSVRVFYAYMLNNILLEATNGVLIQNNKHRSYVRIVQGDFDVCQSYR